MAGGGAGVVIVWESLFFVTPADLTSDYVKMKTDLISEYVNVRADLISECVNVSADLTC